MGHGKKNRGNKRPMDNKRQTTAVKKLKTKIDLIEHNTTHDTKEAAVEQDKGDKEPSVWFGGTIDNNNNESNPSNQIYMNKRSIRLGGLN